MPSVLFNSIKELKRCVGGFKPLREPLEWEFDPDGYHLHADSQVLSQWRGMDVPIVATCQNGRPGKLDLIVEFTRFNNPSFFAIVQASDFKRGAILNQEIRALTEA